MKLFAHEEIKLVILSKDSLNNERIHEDEDTYVKAIFDLDDSVGAKQFLERLSEQYSGLTFRIAKVWIKVKEMTGER